MSFFMHKQKLSFPSKQTTSQFVSRHRPLSNHKAQTKCLMKPNILKLVADGFYREALITYSNQNSASKLLNRFTFPPILKACGKLGLSSHGKSLHAQLLKTGFLSDKYSATALTSMYVNFSRLVDALKVFDEMPQRNLSSMNAIVSGLAQSGRTREAIAMFRDESYGYWKPGSETLASLLSSCESVGFAEMVHCWAVKLGADTDGFLGSSIFSIYSKSSETFSSSKVFEKISDKSLVTYNAYLSSLLRQGQSFKVLNVFADMTKSFEWKPNSVTLVSVVSACTNLLVVLPGRQVHGLVIKLGLALDVMVGTTLVHMYSKFGFYQLAHMVFEELLGVQNLATWNVIISGMMLNSKADKALALFEMMRSEGLEPDSRIWNTMISGFSKLGYGIKACELFREMQFARVLPSSRLMTSALCACSVIPALRRGKEIHGHAIRIGADDDHVLATALIDLYMKCGVSYPAIKVFHTFAVKPKDPGFWNAMISGFRRNGDVKSALEIFNRMLREKVKPSHATFLSAISACSHTGHVDIGWEIFQSMSSEFGMKPKLVHYNCIVDLLARCGRLDEAIELVSELPEPSPSVFACLLGACLSDSNPELAEEMAKRFSELDPKNPMPYVVLSNIYADLGRWSDVERIRAKIDLKGYKKVPGFSFIQ